MVGSRRSAGASSARRPARRRCRRRRQRSTRGSRRARPPTSPRPPARGAGSGGGAGAGGEGPGAGASVRVIVAVTEGTSATEVMDATVPPVSPAPGARVIVATWASSGATIAVGGAGGPRSGAGTDPAAAPSASPRPPPPWAMRCTSPGVTRSATADEGPDVHDLGDGGERRGRQQVADAGEHPEPQHRHCHGAGCRIAHPGREVVGRRERHVELVGPQRVRHPTHDEQAGHPGREAQCRTQGCRHASTSTVRDPPACRSTTRPSQPSSSGGGADPGRSRDAGGRSHAHGIAGVGPGREHEHVACRGAQQRGGRGTVAVPVADGGDVAGLAEGPLRLAGGDRRPVDDQGLGAPVAVDVRRGGGDRRAPRTGDGLARGRLIGRCERQHRQAGRPTCGHDDRTGEEQEARSPRLGSASVGGSGGPERLPRPPRPVSWGRSMVSPRRRRWPREAVRSCRRRATRRWRCGRDASGLRPLCGD